MVNEELYIPIVGTICIALVIVLVFYFRYRTRAAMQQTIRTALEKGQQLTPEIIEQLGQPRQPYGDLRRGVIWLAVGVGFGAFGFILGEEDAVRPFLAIAAFPVAVGIGYLILFPFSEKERST